MAATRKRHTHRLDNEAGTKFQKDARNAFQNEGTRRRHRYCLTHCECLVTPAAGECPEWQRGRTVNPLAYAFVGSSPTSPTSQEPGDGSPGRQGLGLSSVSVSMRV